MKGLNWIGHMVTGLGGRVDPARLVWLTFCVNYIVLTWSQRASFTPVEHATGALLILGGGAGATGGKEVLMAIARGKNASAPDLPGNAP